MDVSGEQLVEVFKALADPTRFAILRLLERKSSSRCGPVEVGESGLCACDVESAVRLSQAAVSHHMAILRRAGLVTAQKRGRWTFYRRDDQVIEAVARALVKHVEAPQRLGGGKARRTAVG
jgi:DNA-binding transcriptional ArsR family regulator